MTEPLDPDMFVKIVGTIQQPLCLELTPDQAVVLIGQLQLALRHPENRGMSSDIAYDLASLLQVALQQQNPDIQPYLDAGWEENVDDLDHC